MTTHAHIADVPARAARDPLLSSLALRVLIYLGQETEHGGFARLSIPQLAVALKAEKEEIRKEEIRIARHQLLHYHYIERRRRAILDEYDHHILGYQYWYRSLLTE